jgi:hypothetical protein
VPVCAFEGVSGFPFEDGVDDDCGYPPVVLEVALSILWLSFSSAFCFGLLAEDYC